MSLDEQQVLLSSGDDDLSGHLARLPLRLLPHILQRNSRHAIREDIHPGLSEESNTLKVVARKHHCQNSLHRNRKGTDY